MHTFQAGNITVVDRIMLAKMGYDAEAATAIKFKSYKNEDGKKRIQTIATVGGEDFAVRDSYAD